MDRYSFYAGFIKIKQFLIWDSLRQLSVYPRCPRICHCTNTATHFAYPNPSLSVQILNKQTQQEEFSFEYIVGFRIYQCNVSTTGIQKKNICLRKKKPKWLTYANALSTNPPNSRCITSYLPVFLYLHELSCCVC